MTGKTLKHLADAQEIRIGFQRPDGSTGSTPVWVVQAGDDIFVRSMHGQRGGWYRRLRANPDGEVQDQAHTHPVRAEPVADAATVEQVTRAYAAKYARSPYVQSLLSEEAAGATLRLQPRPEERG
jgi:deazaflavin-dependent oxidoreductase (nitroreductase family)